MRADELQDRRGEVCPECGTEMNIKHERRDDGIRYTVLYCPGCGLTESE